MARILKDVLGLLRGARGGSLAVCRWRLEYLESREVPGQTRDAMGAAPWGIETEPYNASLESAVPDVVAAVNEGSFDQLGDGVLINTSRSAPLDLAGAVDLSQSSDPGSENAARADGQTRAQALGQSQYWLFDDLWREDDSPSVAAVRAGGLALTPTLPMGQGAMLSAALTAWPPAGETHLGIITVGAVSNSTPAGTFSSAISAIAQHTGGAVPSPQHAQTQAAAVATLGARPAAACVEDVDPDTGEQIEDPHQFDDFTIRYFDGGDNITTSDDLWNYGACVTNPENYHTTVDLLAINVPAEAQTVTWTITSGNGIVQFVDGDDLTDEITQFTFGNTQSTVQLTSIGFSQPGISCPNGANDVHIEVSWDDSVWQNRMESNEPIVGGGVFAEATMSVPTPWYTVRHNVIFNDNDLVFPQGPAFGYRTILVYQIRDQFGNLVPRAIGVNEIMPMDGNNLPDFTNAGNFANYNWNSQTAKTGMEFGGAVVRAGYFGDQVAVNWAWKLPFLMQPNTMHSNVGGAGTLVDTITQSWFVGSTTPGVGVLIQTNTVQRFNNHGDHTNVATNWDWY